VQTIAANGTSRVYFSVNAEEGDTLSLRLLERGSNETAALLSVSVDYKSGYWIGGDVVTPGIEPGEYAAELINVADTVLSTELVRVVGPNAVQSTERDSQVESTSRDAS